MLSGNGPAMDERGERIHHPGTTPTTIEEADIERIIRRDFPGDIQDDVRSELEKYGQSSSHLEINRVHAAILKLADGSMDQLKLETANACTDYRDTLLAAECPNDAASGSHDLPADERRSIRRKDEEQYLAWFQRA